MQLVRLPLLTTLTYALLTALAFPPFNLATLAFAAPIPLIWLARKLADNDQAKPLRAAALVALASLPLWIFETHWVARVSSLGFIPLPIYLSLYPALFVYLAAHTLRAARKQNLRPPAVVWAPILWLACEWLRGAVLFHGFPWYFAGHPLINIPTLARAADLIGAAGVSALTVMTAALITDLAEKRIRTRPIPKLSVATTSVAVIVLSTWFVSGKTREAPPVERTITVGIVQTNIPQDLRIAWDGRARADAWDNLEALTRQAAERTPAPDLIIWPEGIYPGGALDPVPLAVETELRIYWPFDQPLPGGAREEIERSESARFANDLFQLSLDIGVPIIVGGTGMEGPSVETDDDGRPLYEVARTYNSMFLLENGEIRSRYDKLFLTPFGEVMPYFSAIEPLEQALLALGANGMSFGLDPGAESLILEPEGLPSLATPICFEATIARVCRNLVFTPAGTRRAGIIVNTSNDGWFNHFDAGRAQHLLAARWRCVELATPMARSANTGTSAIVDAQGRVKNRLPDRQEGVLVAEISPATGGATLYARTGDALAWTCFGLTATLAAGLATAGATRRVVPRKRQARAEPEGQRHGDRA